MGLISTIKGLFSGASSSSSNNPFKIKSLESSSDTPARLTAAELREISEAKAKPKQRGPDLKLYTLEPFKASLQLTPPANAEGCRLRIISEDGKQGLDPIAFGLMQTRLTTKIDQDASGGIQVADKPNNIEIIAKVQGRGFEDSWGGLKSGKYKLQVLKSGEVLVESKLEIAKTRFNPFQVAGLAGLTAAIAEAKEPIERKLPSSGPPRIVVKYDPKAKRIDITTLRKDLSKEAEFGMVEGYMDQPGKWGGGVVTYKPSGEPLDNGAFGGPLSSPPSYDSGAEVAQNIIAGIFAQDLQAGQTNYASAS